VGQSGQEEKGSPCHVTTPAPTRPPSRPHLFQPLPLVLCPLLRLGQLPGRFPARVTPAAARAATAVAANGGHERSSLLLALLLQAQLLSSCQPLSRGCLHRHALLPLHLNLSWGTLLLWGGRLGRGARLLLLRLPLLLGLLLGGPLLAWLRLCGWLAACAARRRLRRGSHCLLLGWLWLRIL
jgi:hypothetical protein